MIKALNFTRLIDSQNYSLDYSHANLYLSKSPKKPRDDLYRSFTPPHKKAFHCYWVSNEKSNNKVFPISSNKILSEIRESIKNVRPRIFFREIKPHLEQPDTLDKLVSARTPRSCLQQNAFIAALSSIKKLLITAWGKARKSHKISSISDSERPRNFLMHWLLLLWLL